MTDAAARLRDPEAVTFDCWATLLRELKPAAGAPGRAQRFAELTGADATDADAALSAAWREHQVAWHRREIVDGPIMTRRALEILRLELAPAKVDAVVEALESLALEREVVALDGARDALAALAGRGVRIALICDTGFTPGHGVRRLLDAHGLLEWLDFQAFSDETGVPKPNPEIFRRALSAIGAAPDRSLHVGDLRRTDVAGARALGLREAFAAGIAPVVGLDPAVGFLASALDRVVTLVVLAPVVFALLARRPG